MKDKMLTALLVTAAVMVATCGLHPATHRSAPPIPRPTPQPAGSITEFPIPTNCCTSGITAGPDGNLWFTGDAKIGRITPVGQITQFSLPPANSSSTDGITAGPDGNLWFTGCVFNRDTGGCNNGKIGRITPGGQITEFPLPNDSSFPAEITAGPDGNLCLAESTPGSRQRCASESGDGAASLMQYAVSATRPGAERCSCVPALPAKNQSQQEWSPLRSTTLLPARVRGRETRGDHHD